MCYLFIDYMCYLLVNNICVEADRASAKNRQLRRELEEREDELSKERARVRGLQREIADLNESNDTLHRENQTLKVLFEARGWSLVWLNLGGIAFEKSSSQLLKYLFFV